MSNNCIIMPSLIQTFRDGATALGGTWDPQSFSVGVTLSNNNTHAEVGGNRLVLATQHIASGKVYAEVQIDAWSGRYGPLIGLVPTARIAQTYDAPGAFCYWNGDGNSPQVFVGGTGSGQTYGQALGVGDKLGILADLDTNTLTFYKNGVSMGIATTSLIEDDYVLILASPGGSYPVAGTCNFTGPFA